MDSNDVQSWTAARCQRLLRQLQSKLTSLRRIISEDHQVVSKSSANVDERSSKRARLTYGQKSRQQISTRDEAPSTPPRSVRTMGTMRLASSSPISGQVAFRTPVWRKIRAEVETPQHFYDPSTPILEGETSIGLQNLRKSLHSLRQQMPNNQYRLCEAIFEWLSWFLRSTRSQMRQLHRKSLLAMCLRTVPACIADIQLWDRERSKHCKESMWNSSDTAFDIYDQLEAFGSGNYGWKPLKVVVRSHAMTLLANACADGLFRPSFTSVLIGLCDHLYYYEESAKLLRAAVGCLPPPRSLKKSFGETRMLQPLRSVSDSFGKKRTPGPMFDCLSALVEEGRLPSAWLLGGPLSGIWASSLETMTSKKAKPSVIGFMGTVLRAFTIMNPCGSTTRRWAAEQAFIRIVAAISTAAMTVDFGVGCNRAGHKTRAWRRLVHVLECSIANLQQSSCRSTHWNSSLLILAVARFLAVIDSNSSSTHYKRQATEELELLTTTLNTEVEKNMENRHLVLLICMIIQCCRRSHANSGHDVVLAIFSKLDKLGLSSWFGGGLQKDVAFMLANQTKNLRDLVFAESMLNVGTSAAASTMFSGWRWEEGISEWVLPSPIAGVDEREDDTRKNTEIRQIRHNQETSVKDHLIQDQHPNLGVGDIRNTLPARRKTKRSVTSTSHSECKQCLAKSDSLVTLLPHKAEIDIVSRVRKVRTALVVMPQACTSNDEDDLI